MYASTCLFVDRCGSTNLLTDHTHRGFEVRVYRGLRDFWGCVFMLRSVSKQWGDLDIGALRARQGNLRRLWAMEGAGAYGIWISGWSLLAPTGRLRLLTCTIESCEWFAVSMFQNACKQHNPELEELD